MGIAFLQNERIIKVSLLESSSKIGLADDADPFKGQQHQLQITN